LNRVLVIDDEPDVLELISMILTGNGFEVFKALTGEEGLIMVPNVNPDLVVLDVVLPGLSGFEICKLVKGRFKNVKVLMVSALDREIDRRYAEEYGADGYISKPFKKDELLREIDRIMSN